MMCGEAGSPPEATVPSRQSTGGAVIRGPYPSIQRPTRFLPHPIALRPIAAHHANQKACRVYFEILTPAGDCQAQGDLHDLAECGMPLGLWYIASVLSPPALAEDQRRLVKYYTLASYFCYHIRCCIRYHSRPLSGLTRTVQYYNTHWTKAEERFSFTQFMD